MQQKLDKQEESALGIRETFSSLQQEVEIKTRKLKKVSSLFLVCFVLDYNYEKYVLYYITSLALLKLFGKLEAVKQENQDIQEEHSRERQELEQTQNELTRELKLK